MEEKLVIGQVFLLTLRFFLVSIILPMLHIHQLIFLSATLFNLSNLQRRSEVRLERKAGTGAFGTPSRATTILQRHSFLLISILSVR